MDFNRKLELDYINQLREPLISSDCLPLAHGLILIVPGLVRPLRLVTGEAS